MELLRKLHRDESGQSAVLAAMLCGVLIFVIAMTTNLGKVVTEKIQLQNTVDLAVYAGAATQAGRLNKMREKNQEIWQIAVDTRDTLSRHSVIGDPLSHDFKGDGPQCSTLAGIPRALSSIYLDNEIRMAKQRIDQLSRDIDQLNKDANKDAYLAAVDTANANYRGAGDLLKAYHDTNAKLMETDRVTLDFTYKAWCIQIPPGTPVQHTWTNGERFDTWVFKDDAGDVAFVAGIEDAHPNSPWLDVNDYFSSTNCPPQSSPRNGRCGISVYAAAKPFYGKLGAMDNLITENGFIYNLDEPIPLPLKMIVDQSGPIQPFKPKDGMYRDYRVRFVGLFDDEANYTRNNPAGGNPFKETGRFSQYKQWLRH